MRIGLSTPMVMQLPGISSAWERDGEVADLAQIARTADELGFDHLTCAEHTVVPLAQSEGRGLTYWDPLSTLGFLAALTDRIRLATSVIVLAYHHPLEIAKRYGTLDRLSGGRLVLGVGVGSLAEEFEMLGATFDGRGERADDAIAAIRSSISTTRPAYLLPVRRRCTGAVRGPTPRPDLGGRTNDAVAATSSGPGRRVDAVRIGHV
jgi:alkanesulfonate monooxygenase SsuD/methylene tetrahydromethanopterin reductase-like flavin-dependent oxidoreductase (luciferase family)